MTRFLLLAVLALVVFLVLRASLRTFLAGLVGRPVPRHPAATRDELVKDPQCQTYIPRRKAISRTVGSATHFFCSAGCADRFTSRI